MFAGHYGVGFLVKRFEPRIPLWSLFLAVQALDILWGLFVLLGVEKARIVPGITASFPLDLIYIPYSHSLAAALLWPGAVYIALWQLLKNSAGSAKRTALLVALAVFSHWPLDVIVHRADLPLYDDTWKVGFGLWNHVASALLLEGAFLFGGIWLYLRSSKSASNRSKYWVCLFGMVIYGVHCFTVWGPPPKDAFAAAITFPSIFFILAGLALLLERKWIAPRGG